MRFALVSDIHANLQAWKAVLLDVRSLRVDRIVCLGDLVGYGPQPAEVLESLYASVDHFVLGNHDAVVCGKMDAAVFNAEARRVIDWTRGRLGPKAIEFLNALPLTLKAETFRCAHAGFASPATFDYIIDAQDALPSWRAVDDTLLFVGHTHRPGIFVIGARAVPHLLPVQDFVVEANKRYLLNVGSVGHPRDGDARAAYCILDTAAASVCWRRVPFDLDAYREALLARGLGVSASHFLQADPRLRAPPLRAQLAFSPPEEPGAALRATPQVQELAVMRRRVRRWRTVAVLAVAACTLLTATAGLLAVRHLTRAQFVPAVPVPRPPGPAPGGGNLLAVPAPHAATATGLAGWSVFLGDRRSMAVEVIAADDNRPAFRLAARSARYALRLSAAAVPVEPGTRLTMRALFLPRAAQVEELALAAVLTRAEGGGERVDRNFQVKTPNQQRAGGWVQAQATFTVPAGARRIAVELRGRFRGEVQVKGAELVRLN